MARSRASNCGESVNTAAWKSLLRYRRKSCGPSVLPYGFAEIWDRACSTVGGQHFQNAAQIADGMRSSKRLRSTVCNSPAEHIGLTPYTEAGELYSLIY